MYVALYLARNFSPGGAEMTYKMFKIICIARSWEMKVTAIGCFLKLAEWWDPINQAFPGGQGPLG